jgi:AcrR family transcriptional regulator
VGNKSWAGSTLAERQAARRAKLLDAGLALLAEGGGPAASVRAVCREAGVTERYFYENFIDRDALVDAVFDQVSDELRLSILDAVTGRPPREVARAAVDAVVGLTLDQPAKGRALFIAPMTEPVLYRKLDEAGAMLTSMIRDQLRPDESPEHRDLVASSLAGALGHLFHQYVAGTLDVTREAFVGYVEQLLMTLATLPAPVSASH